MRKEVRREGGREGERAIVNLLLRHKEEHLWPQSGGGGELCLLGRGVEQCGHTPFCLQTST